MAPKDWIRYTDEYGNDQVIWNEYVKGQEGAKKWTANSKANGSNYTNVTYIGETGIVERGYTNGNPETAPYQLNADGTVTQLEYGKPTTTTQDPANAEPIEPTAEEKTLSVMGLGARLAEEGSLQGAKMAARATNATESVEEAIRVGKGVDIGLAAKDLSSYWENYRSYGCDFCLE